MPDNSLATRIDGYYIRSAQPSDCGQILAFIKDLAEYEKLSHEVVATEEALLKTLFGEDPRAEVILGIYKGQTVGFAIFFHTYSTFLAESGLYLEDLYIVPKWRGRGFGSEIVCYLAYLADKRDCARMEWSVLDWNEPALKVYRLLGAKPMKDWTVQRLAGDHLQKLARSFKSN
tara:strand:+ start:605 stop:1126 length:522 start_codon:yes stop_codon:yes gene_type:complete